MPAYDPNNSDMVGWAGETTLDVEYAHAIAPGASILLVETPVSETEGVHGFPQIIKAEQYVVRHHLGDVISQSFSATEQTFPAQAAVQALRGAYQLAARNHVTVLAASGDSGAADVKLDGSTYYPFPVTSWPDSDPLVTAVGGTQLHFTATGKPAAPTVWNDTYNRAANEFAIGNAGPNPLAGGGGRSVLFGRPGYQNGVKNVVGGHRGVPDISMSGACNGSVDTYGTYRRRAAGWSPACGTSEATPLFAGIVALAAQVAGHPLGLVNPALYRLAAAHARGIVDVTIGQQHGVVHPGRAAAHGARLHRRARLRPGLRGRHGERRVLRQRARPCGRSLKGHFVPNGPRCEPWERRNHLMFPRCRATPGAKRNPICLVRLGRQDRPRDSARSAIVRRSSRDTLSAGGGTIKRRVLRAYARCDLAFPGRTTRTTLPSAEVRPGPGGKWRAHPGEVTRKEERNRWRTCLMSWPRTTRR